MQKEIVIPDNVETKIEGKSVAVKGPKGEIAKDFNDPRFNEEIEILQNERKIIVKTYSEKRKAQAMVGTIAAHLKNMFVGVSDGYSYELKIVYSHFPITVAAKDGVVEVKNFLGEKGVRKVDIFGTCGVHIEKDIIKVTGINVEDVGQTAANIERACRVRRRDRRIFQDGIFLSARKLQSGREI
ncbi:MAG: 50S ribosomal protein L6 [Candidatus Aenigmarchaeota archaeon]|nr:50S ribosomal protein L6 [Candidatus Aenigmarchaeota archaeon]